MNIVPLAGLANCGAILALSCTKYTGLLTVTHGQMKGKG